MTFRRYIQAPLLPSPPPPHPLPFNFLYSSLQPLPLCIRRRGTTTDALQPSPPLPPPTPITLDVATAAAGPSLFRFRFWLSQSRAAIADSLALACSSGLWSWLVNTPLTWSMLTWGAPAPTLPCQHSSRHTDTHAITAATATIAAHASADAPSLRSSKPPPTSWPWHLLGSSHPSHQHCCLLTGFISSCWSDLKHTITTTTISTIALQPSLFQPFYHFNHVQPSSPATCAPATSFLYYL